MKRGEHTWRQTNEKQRDVHVDEEREIDSLGRYKDSSIEREAN
jgi:hypothetical protein